MVDSVTLIDKFQGQCELIGAPLDARSRDLIVRYCQELEEYNKKVNLVSNADLEVVLRDHVLDSLTLVPLIAEHRGRLTGGSKERKLRLVDIGSGAGFPGVVLASYMEDLSVTLIDSVTKKCVFLQHIVDLLGLSDRVFVANARSEALAHQDDLRGKFDFATARAVGSLPLIAELTLPFLRNGGVLLAQRSCKQLEEDQRVAGPLASKFGGSVIGCFLPDAQITEKQVGILAIKRSKAIPSQYPRIGAKLGT